MQTSFNRGIWSSKLQNRLDLDQYRGACSELVNFDILPQGGVTTRKGTNYLLECYDSAHKSILIPFQYDRGNTFILEFSGNGFLRILKFEGNVLTVKQEGLVTDFTDTELDEMHWVQINKKLYVAHKNHACRKLNRVSDIDWLWTEAVSYPAASRMNRYDVAATLTMAAASGDLVNFSISAPQLQTGDAGRFLVARSDTGKTGYAVITDIGTANTGTCNVIEPFSSLNMVANEWWLQGTGGGKLDPDHSGPEGKITGIHADSIVAGNNYFRSEDVGRYIEQNGGFAKITNIPSVSEARCVIIKNFNDDTPSYNFTILQPEWGMADRYPQTVASYENRLFYGGTEEKKNTVWGSRMQYHDDFTTSPDDEYMLQYYLAGTALQEVLWMVGSQVLVVGTSNGIWTIGREDTSAVLTPTTPMLGFQSTISCAGIRPATIGNVIFFAQRNRKILRSLTASSNINTEAATPIDETLFADPFVTTTAYPVFIEQIVVQSNPYITVWVVRHDGELWGLNYIQEQQVNSWFRFVTDGNVESLAIYPRETEDDLLWITTKRYINGTYKRFIEYFSGQDYPDASKSFNSGAATTTLTGYAHLATKDVVVWTNEQGWLRNSDGENHLFTVTGGNIDITGWTATVDAWAGLPFISEVKTMNWYGGMNDASYEKIRRGTKIKIVMLDSTSGKVGVQVEEDTAPFYVNIFDETPATPFSGFKEIVIRAGTGRIMKLCAKQTNQEILTITGLGCNIK